MIWVVLTSLDFIFRNLYHSFSIPHMTSLFPKYLSPLSSWLVYSSPSALCSLIFWFFWWYTYPWCESYLTELLSTKHICSLYWFPFWCSQLIPLVSPPCIDCLELSCLCCLLWLFSSVHGSFPSCLCFLVHQAPTSLVRGGLLCFLCQTSMVTICSTQSSMVPMLSPSSVWIVVRWRLISLYYSWSASHLSLFC